MATWAMVVSQAACGRSSLVELVECWPACGDAAPTPEADINYGVWAPYVESLALADCPTGSELVVNTTTSELDGGWSLAEPAAAGAALSFPEALWIAVNRPGYDIIHFDQRVFPSDTPGVIAITKGTPLNMGLNDTCIDARGRGVIITWKDLASQADSIWHLQGTSVQMGLILQDMPSSLSIADTARIAGCHFSGGENPDIYGGVVGPGNVFFDGMLTVWRPVSSPLLTGNFYGFDPMFGLLPHHGGLKLGAFSGFDLEDGVFGGPVRFEFDLADSTIVIRNSFFGVDRDGAPTPTLDVWQTSAHTLVGPDISFGPGNVMRGGRGIVTDTIVGITPARLRLTQNSITDTVEGIAWVDRDTADAVVPPPVPSILTASRAGANGTCVEDGTIELFSDDASQGETYIGTTPCTAIAGWSLDLPLPMARNVTATFTTQDGRTSAFSAALPVP